MPDALLSPGRTIRAGAALATREIGLGGEMGQEQGQGIPTSLNHERACVQDGPGCRPVKRVHPDAMEVFEAFGPLWQTVHARATKALALVG